MPYRMRLDGVLDIEPPLSQDDRRDFEVIYPGNGWTLSREGGLCPRDDAQSEEPINQIGSLITDFFGPRSYTLHGRLDWIGEDGVLGTVEVNDHEIRIDSEQDADPVELERSLMESLESGDANRQLLALDLINQDYASLSEHGRFLPHVTALAEEKNIDLRGAAVNALGRFRAYSSRVVPVLVMTLTDPVPWIRSAAAESLGMLGEAGRDALPALEDLTRDHEEGPRSRATEAIRRITARS